MGLEPRQTIPLAIGAINPQMWLVDQDFSVPVTITGNPDEAYITGDVQGFGTDWDSATGILTIEGHPEALLVENTFTIRANKGTQSITEPVLYSVVTPSPVIESFGPLNIRLGAYFEQQINIANNPTDVKVTGPWVFLDHEQNNEGVLIFGNVPNDKNFTIDSGTIRVVASNSGGEDTLSGTANITELASFNPSFVVEGLAVFDGVDQSSTGGPIYFYINLLRRSGNNGRLERYRSDTLDFVSSSDNFSLQSGQAITGGGICAEGHPDFDFYYTTINVGASVVRLIERDWSNIGTRIRSTNLGGRYRPKDITFGNNRIYTVFFDSSFDGGSNEIKVRAYTNTGSYRSADSFTPDDFGSNEDATSIAYDRDNDRIYLFTYTLSNPITGVLIRCYDTSGNRQSQFDVIVPDTVLTDVGISSNSNSFISALYMDIIEGIFYLADRLASVSIFPNPHAS